MSRRRSMDDGIHPTHLPETRMPAAPYRFHHSVRLAVALSVAGMLLPAARAADGNAAQSAAAMGQARQRLEQWMKLPPDVRADCMAAGFGMMSLPTAYMKYATPDLLAQEADTLKQSAQQFHQARLRHDYETMAAQVRQHGGDALKNDGVMNAALADLDGWTKASCPQRPAAAHGAPAPR